MGTVYRGARMFLTGDQYPTTAIGSYGFKKDLGTWPFHESWQESDLPVPYPNRYSDKTRRPPALDLGKHKPTSSMLSRLSADTMDPSKPLKWDQLACNRLPFDLLRTAGSHSRLPTIRPRHPSRATRARVLPRQEEIAARLPA
jgi:hypothetical protein